MRHTMIIFLNARLISVACISACSGKESEFHIEPEITLELMMAANYLHT